MPRKGRPPDIERLKVWTAADGLCSFDACDLDLKPQIFRHRLSPQVSHIVANSDGGPRADPLMSREELNSYPNLMLFCEVHARAVDVMPVREYTVERLQEMKRRHEQRVRDRRAKGQNWRSSIVGEPLYINLPKLLMDSFCNVEVDISFERHSLLSRLPSAGFTQMSLPELYFYASFARNQTANIEANAILLRKRSDIVEEAVGSRFIFYQTARAKGVFVDGSHRARAVTGDFDNDPRVCFSLEGLKVVLPIDPRWITSTTARGYFSSDPTGSEDTKFVGVAILRKVNPSRAIMSPILLALHGDVNLDRLSGPLVPRTLAVDDTFL